MRPLLLATVAMLTASRPVAAQRLSALIAAGPVATGRAALRPWSSSGIAPAPTPASRADLKIALITAAASAGIGFNGLQTGMAVDSRRCERELARDTTPVFLFDLRGVSCVAPIRQSAGVGWYAASVVGATAGGLIAAWRWDECPHRSNASRLARAAGAAVLGAAPGLAYVAAGGRGTSGAGYVLGATVPLTQALAAAALLHGCGGGGR